MNQKQKSCKHIWRHKTTKSPSIGGTPSFWLVHYCLKCKLVAAGELIENIEPKKPKKKSKRRIRLKWW